MVRGGDREEDGLAGPSDWPARSCATATLRAIVRAGPTTRMSSSIAVSQRSGWTRSMCASSGRSSRSASALSIRLVVVSWPPNRSKVHAPTSSSGLSEPTSLCTSAESRFPDGRARSRSTSAPKKVANSRVAETSGASSTPLRREREHDRGEIGRPAHEARAVLGLARRAARRSRARGSGARTPRRARPRRRAGRRRSRARRSRARRPRSAPTRRGVKAARTGSRRRACAGSSRKFIQPESSAATSANAGERRAATRAKISLRSADSRATSRKPASTSACESTHPAALRVAPLHVAAALARASAK